MKQFRCDDRVIPYELRRSRRRKKTIGLSVGAAGLVVTAPQRLSLAAIEEALRAHRTWIIKRLSAPPPAPCQFRGGETVPYLGQPITLKAVAGLKAARLRGGTLELPAGEGARDKVVSWYKQEAQRHFAERVAHYCSLLGLEARAVMVRDQKKRWGSCNAKGELRLNWRLMFMPVNLLDYVIAHEVAHLKHLNHSEAFWRCVGDLMPDYKLRRKALRQQERAVMLW